MMLKCDIVKLETFRGLGLLKARRKQRTDSTHVLAAVRGLNRLESVGETLRAALNAVATVAPEWLTQQIDPAWYDRYEHRFEEYRLPKGETQRTELLEVIGRDGLQLLTAIYAADAPIWLREIPAVERLRQKWVHQSIPSPKFGMYPDHRQAHLEIRLCRHKLN